MTHTSPPPRKRKAQAVAAHFAAHRPDRLQAALARAAQTGASRPVPSLPKLKFLEQPEDGAA